MLPHTSAGVVSLDDRTRLDKRGLRLHLVASERAVAVRRRSGWRMRRFDLEVMEMDETVDDVDGVSEVKCPITLIVSPE